VFAQTLLDQLRFHIIEADDWLFDRTPRTQLLSKFDHRGSPDVVQCLRRSFCGCDIVGLDVALASLCRLYRRQIKQLHTRFELVRPLESDLIAIDLILGEFVARNNAIGAGRDKRRRETGLFGVKVTENARRSHLQLLHTSTKIQ
jgi:hypothetical protein